MLEIFMVLIIVRTTLWEDEFSLSIFSLFYVIAARIWRTYRLRVHLEIHMMYSWVSYSIDFFFKPVLV